jgi:cell division protein FtsI/penicillin-binding protein 2
MENLPTLPDFAGQSAVEIGEKIDSPSAERYLPVAIATNPSPDTVVYVAEHRELFPQVSVTRTSVREYSDAGVAAANLIGSTGEINDAELEAHVGERYDRRHHRQDRSSRPRVEPARVSWAEQGPGGQPRRAGDPITVRKPRAGHDVSSLSTATCSGSLGAAAGIDGAGWRPTPTTTTSPPAAR